MLAFALDDFQELMMRLARYVASFMSDVLSDRASQKKRHEVLDRCFSIAIAMMTCMLLGLDGGMFMAAQARTNLEQKSLTEIVDLYITSQVEFVSPLHNMIQWLILVQMVCLSTSTSGINQRTVIGRAWGSRPCFGTPQGMLRTTALTFNIFFACNACG